MIPSDIGNKFIFLHQQSAVGILARTAECIILPVRFLLHLLPVNRVFSSCGAEHSKKGVAKPFLLWSLFVAFCSTLLPPRLGQRQRDACLSAGAQVSAAEEPGEFTHRRTRLGNGNAAAVSVPLPSPPALVSYAHRRTRALQRSG